MHFMNDIFENYRVSDECHNKLPTKKYSELFMLPGIMIQTLNGI